MKNIRKWFLTGIAAILPVGVTIFVLMWLFNLLDGILAGPVMWIFRREVPGIGLLAIIILIFVVGMFASNMFGKKMVNWLQKMLAKIPIIGTIYKPVSKIASGVSSEKSKSFQKVVTVEFPSKGTTSIGFITNDRISFAGDNKVCVFIPTTPNPTNGFLVFVEKEDVTELDVSLSEGLNMVISIGSAIHGDISLKNEADK